MTDITQPPPRLKRLAAAVETALRDSFVAWYQTPCRLDLAAQAVVEAPAIATLLAERDAYCDRVDTLTAVAKGNKRHVQELHTDLQRALFELDQWQSTFGADALPGALARLAKAEQEAKRLRERVAELEEDSVTLAALHAGGVDNWGGYEDALRGGDL